MSCEKETLENPLDSNSENYVEYSSFDVTFGTLIHLETGDYASSFL